VGTTDPRTAVLELDVALVKRTLRAQPSLRRSEGPPANPHRQSLTRPSLELQTIPPIIPHGFPQNENYTIPRTRKYGMSPIERPLKLRHLPNTA